MADLVPTGRPWPETKWFGNQWYGPVFDRIQQLNELKPNWQTKGGGGFKTNTNWHELDMEKNPDNPTGGWAPAPITGPASVGYNPVAGDPQIMARLLMGQT